MYIEKRSSGWCIGVWCYPLGTTLWSDAVSMRKPSADKIQAAVRELTMRARCTLQEKAAEAAKTAREWEGL